MAYDSVIKLLVDADVPTFYGLLGMQADRILLPTETGHPRTLRLDHVSQSADGEEVLHIEFQASNDEMRWRMLEYYCAIAKNMKLSPIDAIPAVRQLVILVGSANRRACELERDRIHYNYHVVDIRGLDPDRRLIGSRDPYEKVLGLLSVDEPHYDDWRRVLDGIRATQPVSPDRAVDAAALLTVIAEQLLKVPDNIRRLLKDLAVDLRIEESSVLGTLITEQRNQAALLERQRAVLLMLQVSGRTPEADDQEFVAEQDMASLEDIQMRMADGEGWDLIRAPRRFPGRG